MGPASVSTAPTSAGDHPLFSQIVQLQVGGNLMSDERGVILLNSVWGSKSINSYTPDGQQLATVPYPQSDGIEPVATGAAVLVSGTGFPQLAVETATLHPPAGVERATVDYSVTLYDGETLRPVWTSKLYTQTDTSDSPSDIRPDPLTVTTDSKWIVAQNDTSHVVEVSSGSVRPVTGPASAFGNYVALVPDAWHATVLDPVTLKPRYVANPGIGKTDKRIDALQYIDRRHWFLDGDRALVQEGSSVFDVPAGRFSAGLTPAPGGVADDNGIVVDSAANRLYVASFAGTLHAYELRTLRQLWTQKNVTAVYGSSPETVFVATTTGQWAVLDAADGHQIQFAQQPEPAPTSQTVSGKYCWRATRDGTLIYQVLR